MVKLNNFAQQAGFQTNQSQFTENQSQFQNSTQTSSQFSEQSTQKGLISLPPALMQIVP
jgi:hypothetical protein